MCWAPCCECGAKLVCKQGSGLHIIVTLPVIVSMVWHTLHMHGCESSVAG